LEFEVNKIVLTVTPVGDVPQDELQALADALVSKVKTVCENNVTLTDAGFTFANVFVGNDASGKRIMRLCPKVVVSATIL